MRDWALTGKWLLVSLAITVGITALLYVLFGRAAFLGFLFLPFLPILGRGRGRRGASPASRNGPSMDSAGATGQGVGRCPRCDYVARGVDERFCPIDGDGLY